MTGDRPRSHPRQMTPTARQNDTLTHVELVWAEKKLENWISFGCVAEERLIDRSRRVVSFAPESLVAFVRWASNDYGTILSRIDILRAVRPTETYQTLPFVRPGDEVLLTVEGWPKVKRLLQIIDVIEALDIDRVDVAPDHWRHVQNRLAARYEPRTYTRARHCAWLKRRRAGQ